MSTTKAPDARSPDIGQARPSGPPRYTLVHESDGYLIAVYKNVSIIVWGAPATVPMVERLEELAQASERNQSSGGSTIHIIVGGFAPPGDDARKRLKALTERSANRLACAVTVVEGVGFWASAMRGMVTSFHWIKARRFKSHMCTTLEEAAAWLPAPHAESTSTLIEQSELLHVLRDVRGRITLRNSGAAM